MKIVEERIGEAVVERKRDRDQQRAEDEDQERSLLQQTQSLHSKNFTKGYFLADVLRRRVWQGERVDSHHDRSDRRHLQRQRALLDVGKILQLNKRDRQTRDHSTIRSPHTHSRELLVGAFHLVKR